MSDDGIGYLNESKVKSYHRKLRICMNFNKVYTKRMNMKIVYYIMCIVSHSFMWNER